MEKWPSGRWRQTVNLLGNSRWFEPSFFHYLHSAFLFKLKLKKILFFKSLKKKQTFLDKPIIHKYSSINFFLGHVITKPTIEYFNYNTLFYILIHKKNKVHLLHPPMVLSLVVQKWLKAYYYYSFLWDQPYLDLFFSKQRYHLRDLNVPYYVLILTFRQGRLFVNLLNKYKLNYLYLSLGLFTRFFSSQKAFKKNKILKIVLAKYIRKLLLITQLDFIDLYVKSSPFMLLELMTYLLEPLQKAFKDPLSGITFDETRFNYKEFRFNYIYFYQSRQYNLLKIRKKGRIKRKLQKKLVKLNKKVD